MIGAKAPAKLNLVFEVGPRRADGYHSVLSLYQSLALFEEVWVEKADAWAITVTGDLDPAELEQIPLDDSNLVIKAAHLLTNKAGISNPQPMHLKIVKRVPAAGGVAGGSADAAAALVALNEAWCLGFEKAQLQEFGAELGADVPFAILGGTAIGTDSGIQLESLPALEKQNVLLVFSKPGISTKDSFAVFDELYPAGDIHLEPSSLRNPADYSIGRNSLLEPAFRLRPDLQELMDLVPGKVNLSGSGPTLYLLGSKAEVATWKELFQAKGLSTLETSFGTSGAELI